MILNLKRSILAAATPSVSSKKEPADNTELADMFGKMAKFVKECARMEVTPNTTEQSMVMAVFSKKNEKPICKISKKKRLL